MFVIDTNGSSYTVLHRFSGTPDGADAATDMTLSGGILYGSTYEGGAANNGVLFAFNTLNTNGTGFTNIYSFSATSGSNSTNSDGAHLFTTPLFTNNSLYGMAASGGTTGNGTIFQLLLPSPTLHAAPSFPSNTILTWSINANGFILQSTTNLMSQSWTNVPIVPVIVNGQYTITNPTSSLEQFFRLAQ